MSGLKAAEERVGEFEDNQQKSNLKDRENNCKKGNRIPVTCGKIQKTIIYIMYVPEEEETKN